MNIWEIKKSNIHGLGVFSTVKIMPNTIIEKVIVTHNPTSAFFYPDNLHDVTVFNKRYLFNITPFGSRINHKSTPKSNSKLSELPTHGRADVMGFGSQHSY